MTCFKFEVLQLLSQKVPDKVFLHQFADEE